MRLTLETIRKQGRLVADTERYRIHDYDLGDLTVSVTDLKKGQETRGHSHASNAEVYFFDGGEAEMEVGKDRFEVDTGAVLIPQGEFHRVVNKSKTSDLTFVAVFSGKRELTRARYARGAVVSPGAEGRKSGRGSR